MNQSQLDLRSITPINARFWVHINGSPVKITLRPDESLCWDMSEPTDEGYRYVAHKWCYDGYRVYDERSSGGSDCDGRIDHYSDLVCPVKDLAASDRIRTPKYSPIDGEIMSFPDWQKLSTHQRDHSAEAMGY